MTSSTDTPRVLCFPNGETLSAHLITAVRDYREAENKALRHVAVEYVFGQTHAQMSAFGDSEVLDEFIARARDHHMNPFERGQP